MIPEYEDKVTFVNAISGDPTGDQLALDFPFQYIPMSFFLANDGEVVDSYAGPLTEDEMRAQLDRLLAQ